MDGPVSLAKWAAYYNSTRDKRSYCWFLESNGHFVQKTGSLYKLYRSQ